MHILTGKDHDLGGFHVRRLLPARERRMVGPFIFFDFIAPAVVPAALNSDIRPHPHIGLATVTFLYDGALLHRDSLGSEQVVRGGDVNWMTAGRGIVHSERTIDEQRGKDRPLHGVQLWVALPTAHEEDVPSFTHHPSSSLPVVDVGGARLKVLAGEAFGVRSPAPTLSPLFYVDAQLAPNARLDLAQLDYAERGVFLVDGDAVLRSPAVPAPAAAAPATAPLTRHAITVVDGGGGGGAGGAGGTGGTGGTGGDVVAGPNGAHVLLLGGAPLDGPRHAYWNFVSSSRERIERAKNDWRERRFAAIPGDDEEFIPLPADASGVRVNTGSTSGSES